MRRILSLALAALLTLVAATPVAAYEVSGWPGTSWKPTHPNCQGQQGCYEFNIPVCLHDNIDGPTGNWDVANNAQHAVINWSLQQANSLGGELYFYQTNQDCDDLNAQNAVFLQIGWGNAMSAVAKIERVDFEFNMRWPSGVAEKHLAIWIDSTDPIAWSLGAYPPAWQYDGATVVLHEIAHAFGLSHSQVCGGHNFGAILGISNDHGCTGLRLGNAHRWLHDDDKDGYRHYFGNTR